MSDLIDRQAAIDAVTFGITYAKAIDIATGEAKELFAKENEELRKAAERIKQLPSAQPEIIRCKDCKYRDPEDKKCDCGHDIVWNLPRQDDWYCADAERRTE